MHSRSGGLEVLQQVQERVRPGGRSLRVGRNKSGVNWVHTGNRWNVFCMQRRILFAVWWVLSVDGVPGEYSLLASYHWKVYKMC